MRVLHQISSYNINGNGKGYVLIIQNKKKIEYRYDLINHKIKKLFYKIKGNWRQSNDKQITTKIQNYLVKHKNKTEKKKIKKIKEKIKRSRMRAIKMKKKLQEKIKKSKRKLKEVEKN